MYTEVWVVLTCGNDTVYNRVLERVQHSVVPSDPRRIRKEGTRIEFPVSVETQRATTQARILGQRFLEDRLDPQDRREVEMSVRTKVKEQKLTEGTSFTPGPWRAEYGRYGEQWTVIASNRTVVAQCSAGMTSDPEQGPRSRQFDAKLIAAAPEMFDLVQSALSLWGFMVNDLSLSKDERAAAQRNLEKARQVVGAITESTHSQPAPRLRPLREQKLTEGTSFTPGPWTLEAGRTIQTRSGKFHLAYRTDPQTSEKEFSSPTELDANARLIAAAPDLLNACVAMGEKVPWVHNAGVTEDIEALRAVCLAYADVWNNLMSQAIDKAGVEYNTNEARQVVGAIIESVHSRPAPRLRPLRERMTRAEIESEFDIQYGLIKDPGKFAGAPIYAPYFYDLWMESGSDDDVYGADDTLHSVFFITDEDRAQFPELKEEEIEALHVWEDDDGFFNMEDVTREEWGEFKAQREKAVEEGDEDVYESCRKGKKGKRVAPKLRGKSQSDGKPQKVEAKPQSRTPQDHQTAIAIRTLKMAAPMAGVMGGPSKEEARRHLLSIGWSQAKIDALTNSQSSRKGASQKVQQESVVSEKKRKIDYGRLHQQGAKPETFNMPQHTVKGE